MSKYIGNFKEDATVQFKWSTNDLSGASITRSADGSIKVYKDAGTTAITTGITNVEDWNSLTGIHHCTIDLSASASYVTGSEYFVTVEATTIDGQVVNFPLRQFGIENGNRYDLQAVLDALDTAVPGSPTANSINERVKAIDDKLPSGTISDFDETADPVELLDTGGSAGTSAEELVDDIFNEALSGHVAGGSAGEALNRLDDIQAKTDLIPADPATETNVDANEAKIDLIQTDVTAIKAKTDLIPADPATETNVDANEAKIDLIQTDVTAIKAKTDLIPADPATETNVDANEAKIDLLQIDSTAIKAKTDLLTFTGSNVNSHVKAEDNIDFGALKKASINTEVDNALDTAIPLTPTADSINDILKDLDAKLPTGAIAEQTDIAAIKAKTDNLPADPASETNVDANEAKIDLIQTDVTAIKAKTDLIPADPATETNVDANETKIDALQLDVTAIKAKTDNLPADPASETNVDANETKIDLIQTDVTAIKAKTDLIPADPASETNVDANETKIDAVMVSVEKTRKEATNKVVVNGTDTQVDVYEDNGVDVAFSFTISGDRRTRTPI